MNLGETSHHDSKTPTTRRDDVPDKGRLEISHIALLIETTAAMRAAMRLFRLVLLQYSREKSASQ